MVSAYLRGSGMLESSAIVRRRGLFDSRPLELDQSKPRVPNFAREHERTAPSVSLNNIESRTSGKNAFSSSNAELLEVLGGSWLPWARQGTNGDSVG